MFLGQNAGVLMEFGLILRIFYLLWFCGSKRSSDCDLERVEPCLLAGAFEFEMFPLAL